MNENLWAEHLTTVVQYSNDGQNCDAAYTALYGKHKNVQQKLLRKRVYTAAHENGHRYCYML